MNTTKYKFIYSLIFIGVISCKQKQPIVNEQETVSVKHDINIIDRGRSIYSYNCATCHNYQGHNTDYHPALNEYISMDRDTLLRKLKVFEFDSLHKRMLTVKQRDTLKSFLTIYDGIIY